MKVILAFVFSVFFYLAGVSQDRPVLVTGTVISGNTPVSGANVVTSSGRGTTTDSQGSFRLTLFPPAERSVSVTHVSFYPATWFLPPGAPDSVNIRISLEEKNVVIEGVSIHAENVPDTVVGSTEYSILDFAFSADTLVVLAYPKVPGRDQQIIFFDAGQQELRRIPVPDEVNELYNDFAGRMFGMSPRKIYEISAGEASVSLFPLEREEFERRIMPCVDTLTGNILFSDYSRHFPAFTYYAYEPAGDTVVPVRFVEDAPLHRQYRYEFYFLNPRDKHLARRLSREFGVDVHTVAAAMTGFTNSWYFDPLYAPLFVKNDTILVFDHYSDHLVRYDSAYRVLDSTGIDYHKTRKASEWRKQILRDELTGELYGLFRKDNYHELRRIDPQKGDVSATFRLYYRYVEKIRIRNGYVYYTYHPFSSLQKKFLYRERIR